MNAGIEGNRLARNIQALRDKFDLTQQELADVAGVSRQSVVDWEKGRRKTIRQNEVIEAITSHFGITSEDLFADYGLYEKLHGLTAAPAGAVAPSGSSRTVPVRVLGATHAGEAMDEDEIDGIVCDVPAEVFERHPEAFLLRVEGDCMNRRYPEGCMVLVDPNMEPANGRAVVAELPDGRSVLRSYLRGQSVLMLTADSYSAHEDIVITDAAQPVRCLGVVVWYQAEKDIR